MQHSKDTEAPKVDHEEAVKVFGALQSLQRIPELDWKATIEYTETTKEELLYPLVEQNQVLIIAGAAFGDEGKGKTVHDVAHHPGVDMVVRVNSGENAGHTVYNSDGKKYVFHLAPSGVLLPNKTNMIGPECVMDPISFFESEIKPMIKDNISYLEKLFIGNVHIVAPYHKLIDFLSSPNNSSTLKGMSPIHASKVTKRGLRLDHIFNNQKIQASRLQKDLQSYYAALHAQKLTEEQLLEQCNGLNSDGHVRIPWHVIEFLQATDKVAYLIELYQKHVVNNELFPKRKDVSHEIRKVLDKGGKILVEGPQSFWLSNASEKCWESSTSADTSAPGLYAAARFNISKYKAAVVNIHKTPASSRVGIGANPASYVKQDFFSRQGQTTLQALTDLGVEFDNVQKQYFASIQPNGLLSPTIYKDKSGNELNIGQAMAIASALKHGEHGATTLKPRVCGVFDCVAQYEVNEVQGPYLSISAVDRGDDYDKIALTIAYVYHNLSGETTDCNGRTYTNGDVIKAGDPMPTEQVLYHCYPIIYTVDGWKDTPIASGKRKANDPLPKGVQQLIAAVEHFTGSQVISIGNGPKQKDFIYVKRQRTE